MDASGAPVTAADPPALGSIDKAPRTTGEAQAQPPVRGERGFRLLDAGLSRLERAVQIIPERLNPLAQTGAVANVSLIIAILSGALLLFWYTPSVQGAHSSLDGIRGLTVAQLLRSLHRYSSDACVFFVFLHALRAVSLRQLAGARSLAWITGFILVFLLWMTGWSGYWLVWDQRGQQVAVGTARALDVLPVFIDPLSRSFLTDAGVNSLFFFVVFFIHMLLPMAMGIALWLHIARMSRPRFLTRLPLALWIVGTLLALSVIAPAVSAPAAHMAETPQRFTMDWWYLLPLALTDRLGGGALWAIFTVTAALLFTAPRWLVRRGRDGSKRPVPAEVDTSKCNACRQCTEDCPYGAIRMVKRTDGRKWPAHAEVIADKCIGCGICAGSCDSSGIGLAWLPAVAQRARIDGWLAAAAEPTLIAFVCAESGGRGLRLDADTGRCAQLPGYRVIDIPCAGWLHPLTVERALRRGAAGVLVVGGTGCSYREGAQWTEQRLAGQRGTAMRTDKVDASKVRWVQVTPGATREVIAAAAALRAEVTGAPAAREPVRARGDRPVTPRVVLAGLAVSAACATLTWLPSDLPYATAASEDPELVVSFKHPGVKSETCRKLSAEELADKPVHLRQETVCERSRAPVRLRVTIDGKPRMERSYTPSGLFEDGNSIAVERLSLSPGRHLISLDIADSHEEVWNYHDEREVTFEAHRREVVLFDRGSFAWH